MERGIYFSIVGVCDSLRGTPDYSKVIGITPAAITHWELRELLDSGISFDGVRRVIAQNKVKRAPVREEEPCVFARVLLKQARNLVDAVLSIVNVPASSVDRQRNHGSSSSLGVIGSRSKPNGEGSSARRPDVSSVMYTVTEW